MTTFLYHNLLWDVDSPSYWRLNPEHTNGAEVDVSFIGDRWCLFLAEPDGRVTSQMFPTRDAAIGMVAQAFQRVL